MNSLTSQPSQEYPIRALVRGDNYGSMDKRLAGTVRQWKSYDRRFMTACDLGGCDCRGKSEWYCGPEHLIIDPSPAQIAEERAKAGLPAEPSEGKKDLEPVREDAHRSPSGFLSPAHLDHVIQAAQDQELDEHLQRTQEDSDRAQDIAEAAQGAAEGEALPERSEGAKDERILRTVLGTGPGDRDVSIYLPLPSAPRRMRVRITKAGQPTYWYADKIGQEFLVEVSAHALESDFKVAGLIDEGVAFIGRDDCEFLTFPVPSAPSVTMGGVDLEAIEAKVDYLDRESLIGDKTEKMFRDLITEVRSLRAALSKLEGRCPCPATTRSSRGRR